MTTVLFMLIAVVGAEITSVYGQMQHSVGNDQNEEMRSVYQPIFSNSLSLIQSTKMAE